jgi:hypothetical protein
MGICNFGAPRQEIEFLVSHYPVRHFIETGTYRGDTSEWAASVFEKVATIEGSPALHKDAKQRLSHLTNIDCHCGDSRSHLPEILQRIGCERALFWLDAHWMPECYGKESECPLVDELRMIRESGAQHIILIDDARMFLAPPQLPHRASDWPTIDMVIEALSKPVSNLGYTFVYNDVIYNVPSILKDVTMNYIQGKITETANTPAPIPFRTKVKKLIKNIIQK